MVRGAAPTGEREEDGFRDEDDLKRRRRDGRVRLRRRTERVLLAPIFAVSVFVAATAGFVVFVFDVFVPVDVAVLVFVFVPVDVIVSVFAVAIFPPSGTRRAPFPFRTSSDSFPPTLLLAPSDSVERPPPRDPPPLLPPRFVLRHSTRTRRNPRMKSLRVNRPVSLTSTESTSARSCRRSRGVASGARRRSCRGFRRRRARGRRRHPRRRKPATRVTSWRRMNSCSDASAGGISSSRPATTARPAARASLMAPTNPSNDTRRPASPSTPNPEHHREVSFLRGAHRRHDVHQQRVKFARASRFPSPSASCASKTPAKSGAARPKKRVEFGEEVDAVPARDDEPRRDASTSRAVPGRAASLRRRAHLRGPRGVVHHVRRSIDERARRRGSPREGSRDPRRRRRRKRGRRGRVEGGGRAGDAGRVGDEGASAWTSSVVSAGEGLGSPTPRGGEARVGRVARRGRGASGANAAGGRGARPCPGEGRTAASRNRRRGATCPPSSWARRYRARARPTIPRARARPHLRLTAPGRPPESASHRGRRAGRRRRVVHHLEASRSRRYDSPRTATPRAGMSGSGLGDAGARVSHRRSVGGGGARGRSLGERESG